MTSALQVLTVLLPTLYLGCAVLHAMAFGGPRAPRVEGMRRGVTVALILVHAAWFVVYAGERQAFPIDDLASSLSAVVFSTLALQTALARWTKQPGSGGLVLALLFGAQLLASALTDIRALPQPGTPTLIGIVHVTTSVVALAALVLSGVHGLLYLVLLRQMRLRQFGALFAGLPDLDVLARMTRGAALLGFLGLAVGVNVGIGLAHRDHSSGFAYREAEVALSILLWLHFGAIAFSSRIRGFNARRASLAAAVGLLVVLLSLALVLVPGVTFHGHL
jgi:ABC-type uncharacterized transport system permease subunit